MGGVSEMMLRAGIDTGSDWPAGHPQKSEQSDSYGKLLNPEGKGRVWPRVHPRRRNNKIYTLLAASLLAGCAATTPRVETVRVLVPTPVPCVAAADVPVRPAPLDARPAADRDAVRMLLAKLLEWAGPGAYGDRAAAVFTGCVR